MKEACLLQASLVSVTITAKHFNVQRKQSKVLRTI
jgi:hypothetical protein